MLFVLQILPLALYLLVGFQLHVSLAPLEAIFLIAWDKIVEQQSVGTLLLIFWKNTHKHEIDTLCLMHLQCPQTVPPAERPQTTPATLLQGTRHRSDGNADADDIMVRRVPVFNQANQVHIEHGEIHLQIFIYLSLSHLRVTVQVAEGLVYHFEHLAANLLLTKHLAALGVGWVQIITLHYQLGNLLEFLRNALLWNDEFELYIVAIFLPTTYLFEVLGVIGVIIDSSHRAHLVEALYKHTFWIHISKAQWADHLCHSFLASPVLNGFEKRTTHLNVINEINPSEADTLTIPALVGPAIDNACNTAYHFSVLIGQEILSLAELESSILVFAEGMKIVTEQVGCIILIALIQIIMKVDESRQTLLICYLPNLY